MTINYEREYNLLEKMTQLEAEGVEVNQQSLLDGITYNIKSEKTCKYMGFITLRIDDEVNMCILQHFYMLTELRKKDSCRNAREFTRNVVKLLSNIGLTKVIISVKKNYLARCVEYFFKVKPYAVEDNGFKYYLVPILRK